MEETGCPHNHDNPLCDCFVNDPARADLFLEHANALAESDHIDRDDLRLMPLGPEGKEPWIRGRTTLETDEAASVLHTVDEAAEAIKDGHPGFVFYHGREDHGTENELAVDRDEPDDFPTDDMPETGLVVVSGSGTDPGHYYYVHDGAGFDRNAAPGYGETRAKNWYTVAAGSIHPSGGIYHCSKSGEPAEIQESNLPEGLQPGENTYSRSSETIELDPPDELASAEFTNKEGVSLEQIREWDDGLDRRLRHLDHSEWNSDTSRGDYQTAWRLAYWRFTRSDAANIIRRYRSRAKVRDRREYLDRTVSKAFSSQTEQYEPYEPEDFYRERITALLPKTRGMEGIEANWNYLGKPEPTIPKPEVHDRVQGNVGKIFSYGDRALLEAPMGSGKTTSIFKEYSEGDYDGGIAYFGGRREMATKEIVDICEDPDIDLTYQVLPRAEDHCPIFRGDFGEEWYRRVDGLRNRGMMAHEIHEHLNLPCDQESEEGCPLHGMWSMVQESIETVDVIIGTHQYAMLPHVSMGRHVVVDENPISAYTTNFVGSDLEKAINAFCEIYDDFPFEGYVDLIERRRDEDAYQAGMEWFEDFEFERDYEPVAHHDEYHAYAPHAAQAILDGKRPGGTVPIERARLVDEEGHLAIFDHGDTHNPAQVSLQTPPDWPMIRSMACLDGTPDKLEWERAVGKKLNHRKVLASDEEKHDYVTETLGIEAIDLSEGNVHPHSSGKYVNVDRVATAAWALYEEFGRRPVVFDTKRATRQYEEAGLLEEDGGPIKELDNFENLRGSNQYGDERLAIIAGSPNYGHRWVQRHAAWENQAVFPEGKGSDLTFGDFGDRYLEQMREAVVAQSAMRVGRDGNSAVVAFLTTCYPDYFDAKQGSILKTYTEHQSQVLDAAVHLQSIGEEVTTTAVYDHPDVECGRRNVHKVLRQFEDMGNVDADRSGKAIVWTVDGLKGVNPHGQTEIPEIEVGSDEDLERSRNTNYTLPFEVTPDDCDDTRHPAGDLSVRRYEDPVSAPENDPPPA